MKKQMMEVAAVVALAASGLLAGAQTSTIVKDDLFAGTEKFAKGASDVTELTMDPQTLQMVGGRDAHRAHRMVLNVVHTYSYDKPGMYNIADVEEFRNKLNTGDWHCSVHTRDMKHGESTDICNKSRTDGMVETAIITVEPKELTFIHTIKQGGEGGGSELIMPMGMNVFEDGGPAAMAEMKANMAVQMAMLKPQILGDLSMLNSGQMQMEMDAARRALNGIRLDNLKIIPDMHDMQLHLDEMKRSAPSDSDMQKIKQQLDDLNKHMADAPKQPE